MQYYKSARLHLIIAHTTFVQKMHKTYKRVNFAYMAQLEYLLDCLINDLKEDYYERTPETPRETVKWATTTFRKLASMMTNDGYHIGENTLRSIISGKWIIDQSNAKAHTLNKCVKWLGYKDWQEFAQKKGDLPSLESLHGDSIFNAITKAHKGIWDAHKKLPEINTSLFLDFFIKNTRQYKNVCGDIVRLANSGATLVDDSFHIIQYATIKWITNNKACVETRESIKINFHYPPTPGHIIFVACNKYAAIDNGFTTQNPSEIIHCIYLMIRKTDGWKIGARYPNVRYDDAKETLIGYHVGTREPFYSLPNWHESVQKQYFSDDQDYFEFGK